MKLRAAMTVIAVAIALGACGQIRPFVYGEGLPPGEEAPGDERGNLSVTGTGTGTGSGSSTYVHPYLGRDIKTPMTYPPGGGGS